MKGKTALKEIGCGMEPSGRGGVTQKKSALRHDPEGAHCVALVGREAYQLFLRWASRASVCSSKDAKPA